jgi:hypothetical protein
VCWEASRDTSWQLSRKTAHPGPPGESQLDAGTRQGNKEPTSRAQVSLPTFLPHLTFANNNGACTTAACTHKVPQGSPQPDYQCANQKRTIDGTSTLSRRVAIHYLLTMSR